MQLKPKKYKKHTHYWADTPEPDLTGVDWFYEAGFVAQEVEKIPELKYLVTATDTETINLGTKETKTVNYIEMIPYLVKAVQEQNQIVTAQAELIQKLENRIRILENS